MPMFAPDTWATDEFVTGAKMQTEINAQFTALQAEFVPWTPYTTSWQGLYHVNNGTLAAFYARTNGLIHWRVRALVGSTTTFTGSAFSFTSPTTPATDGGAAGTSSFDKRYHAHGWMQNPTGNPIQIFATNAPDTATYVCFGYNGTPITNTAPFTVTTGTFLHLAGWYVA